jgi:hypothetical protein
MGTDKEDEDQDLGVFIRYFAKQDSDGTLYFYGHFSNHKARKGYCCFRTPAKLGEYLKPNYKPEIELKNEPTPASDKKSVYDIYPGDITISLTSEQEQELLAVLKGE